MADYESLAHLSRWRRLVIWFCEDSVGRNISGLLFVGILFGPALVVGRWWMLVGAAFVLGFWAGYRLACSFIKSGQIPPEV